MPFALFALADDGVTDSLVGAPDAIFHIDIARRVYHDRQFAVVAQHGVIPEAGSDKFLLFLPSGQAIMVDTGPLSFSKT